MISKMIRVLFIFVVLACATLIIINRGEYTSLLPNEYNPLTEEFWNKEPKATTIETQREETEIEIEIEIEIETEIEAETGSPSGDIASEDDMHEVEATLFEQPQIVDRDSVVIE